jgi:squalene-hopene/tetraprenyl-beta-curcumene cyclase
MAWPGAARDHDTFCISCHTALPYALSRPALRKALAEQGLSAEEQKLLDNVTKRVNLWNEIGPFYSDKEGYDNTKAAESRGTEAVLNALILANYDAENGHLSDVTRAAFKNMWALQQTEGDGKGAWRWLRFGMEPWEANDSQYYGAALAAIAVGTAPEDYRSRPDIRANVADLRDYLNREYAKQSTLNRVVLLWASTKLPGLLEPKRQQAIIREVSDQQQSDGGWTLSSLAWPGTWSLHSIIRTRLRSDWTRQDTKSDGYATGFITFVLQQAGVPGEDPHLKEGLSWLATHQSSEEGSWPSLSLTKRRDPSSNTGHFMRDAATAYAVLALSESGRLHLASGEPEHKNLPTPSSPNVDLATRSN